MSSYYLYDILKLTTSVTFIILFIFYAIFKLIQLCLFLKYKCKLKFDFIKLNEFNNIVITIGDESTVLSNDPATRHSTTNFKRPFRIQIENLKLNSKYLDRNQKVLFNLNLKNVQIEIEDFNHLLSKNSNKSTSKSSHFFKYSRLINWIIYLLKYISVNIEKFELKTDLFKSTFDLFNLKSNVDKHKQQNFSILIETPFLNLNENASSLIESIINRQQLNANSLGTFDFKNKFKLNTLFVNSFYLVYDDKKMFFNELKYESANDLCQLDKAYLFSDRSNKIKLLDQFVYKLKTNHFKCESLNVHVDLTFVTNVLINDSFKRLLNILIKYKQGKMEKSSLNDAKFNIEKVRISLAEAADDSNLICADLDEFMCCIAAGQIESHGRNFRVYKSLSSNSKHKTTNKHIQAEITKSYTILKLNKFNLTRDAKFLLESLQVDLTLIEPSFIDYILNMKTLISKNMNFNYLSKKESSKNDGRIKVLKLKHLSVCLENKKNESINLSLDKLTYVRNCKLNMKQFQLYQLRNELAAQAKIASSTTKHLKQMRTLFASFSQLTMIKSKETLNEFCLIFNEFYLCWSTRIHQILFDSIYKPFKSINEHFELDNLNNKHMKSNLKVKLLSESNMHMDFLFDYTQETNHWMVSPFLADQTTQTNAQSTNSTYFNTYSKFVHKISIVLNKFHFYLHANELISFNFNSLSGFLNDNEQFFYADKSSISYTFQSEHLRAERELVHAEKASNNLLKIKFNIFYVNFLFNYEFAKLIDHVLNLRKCYWKTNKEKHLSDEISADVLLEIGHFNVSIEDDPFETSLAYNYALISDEYFESLKRRQTLEQRRLIKEQNLESAAYELLKEKESSIYIKRSQMLKNAKPLNSKLFKYTMDNFSLYALADTKWHGAQKCFEMIKSIDKTFEKEPLDSHLPSEYAILWCRYVCFNSDEFKFLFRDYTQPLLKMSKLNAFGHLIGAEYKASPCSVREITIDVGTHKFHVQRNMSPFKVYHDLSSKMSSLICAYGPCWEGCMAQFNLSLDKIIHPQRDPSKPMPWWDKSRLYVHGRYSSCVEQLQIIYHVSMDPYNHTEEMKWVWTNLYFDWTERQFLFKGILDIYLNTESKYDACCLLHMPDLEMKINFDWLCRSSQNSHIHVTPCAPNKVSSREHDTYAQFRSEKMNVSIWLKCNVSNEHQLPTIKFYASTGRFLERIKNLLSAITRPTKRGCLFKNFKPRKPILSRHFNIANLSLDVPKLQIKYWSSASEEYGVQIECEHYRMNSSHCLNLIPFTDQLKRRPRPCWSIELMKCNLTQINIYLMSPNRTTSSSSSQTVPTHTTSSNSQQQQQQQQQQVKHSKANMTPVEYDLQFLESTNDEYLSSTPAMKNFFMQIDSIYYERQQKHNQTGAQKKSYSPNQSMSSLIPIYQQPKHNLVVRNLKAKWNNTNRDVIFTLYEIYNKSRRLRHNISSHALKQYDEFTDQIINQLSQSFSSKASNLPADSNHVHSMSSEYLSKEAVKNQQFNTDSNRILNDYKIFEDLLRKLDMEREFNLNVHCNEKENLDKANELLYGVHAVSKMFDILSENVFVELINMQVKLSLDESSAAQPASSNVNAQPKQQCQVKSDKPGKRQKLSNQPPQQPQQQQTHEPSKNLDYLIVSASKANLIQRLHKPVWKSQGRLLDKCSWSGFMENMQYFATLNSSDTLNTEPSISQSVCRKNCNQKVDDEFWLSDDLIDGSYSSFNEITSSNSSSSFSSTSPNSESPKRKNNLGMIVSIGQEDKSGEKEEKANGTTHNKQINNTINSVTNNHKKLSIGHFYNERNLQLIVSKCRCEFYMIDFDDKLPDSEENEHQIDRHQLDLSSSWSFNGNKELNLSFNEPIDCFTLIHHDLNMCTNSSQYKIIMELVNNLVLYFRPRRKQTIDKQKSIKFNLQLSMANLDSLKQYIQLKQIEAKQLLCKIRLLEKQLYRLRERIISEMNEYNLKYSTNPQLNNHIYVIHELRLENKSMEKEYRESKRILNELSDELNISISCYKDIMLERRASNLTNTSHQSLLSSSINSINENGSNSNSNNSNNKMSNKSDKNNSDLVYENFLHNLNKNNDLNNYELARRYEVLFKQTKWKLNDSNGVNGCAEFLMKNLLYTKVANHKESDCVEHTLEIESCKIKDLEKIRQAKKSNDKAKADTVEHVLCGLFETDEFSELREKEENEEDEEEELKENSVDNEKPMSSETNKRPQESESKRVSSASSVMLRLYFKERPPVGIPVFEHLELNISPISIKLTNRFYKMLLNFFFDNQILANTNPTNPTNHLKRNPNDTPSPLLDNQASTANNFKHMIHNKKPSQSSILSQTLLMVNNSTTNVSSSDVSAANLTIINNNVNLDNTNNANSNNSNNASVANNTSNLNNNTQNNSNNNTNTNDNCEEIEIMKQRSANNNTFLCIKITEIQLLVSYKGGDNDNTNNIRDLNNVSLLFPLFEVHDKTWTWLDLINALKSHVKKALLSQAIRHKLIKAPIQPVNKLISRSRLRSNSQQHLTNIELEEQEKLTVLKMFGTSLIEKNANLSLKDESINNEDSKSERVRSKLTKSQSSVGVGLKKKFLKLTGKSNKTSTSLLESNDLQ